MTPAHTGLLALTLAAGAAAGGDPTTDRLPVDRWPPPAFIHLSPATRSARGPAAFAPVPVRLDARLGQRHWIELNLATDVSYWAVREHLDDSGGGDFVWSGRVQDQPLSRVSLSVCDGVAAGSIVVPGAGSVEAYRLQPTASGESWLVAADESPTGDGVPLDTPPLPAAADTPGCAALEDPAVVDVMVLYTPATRQRWGTSGIQAKIREAIAYSNLGYQNSGVFVTLNLAYLGEVDYVETGRQFDALEAMRHPSDGKLDEVPRLRDQWAVDLVTLISEDRDGRGLSYVMTTVSTAFADFAFNVVGSSFLDSTALTYPHELGHLFGCQHDRDNASTPGAYPYSYGYRHCPPDATTFRTIMAYDCGGVTRVNYYSTPDLTYAGYPLGVSHLTAGEAAENVLSINNTAHTVQNFRIPPSAPPAAPANLAAIATAPDSVILLWTDRAENESSYRIERSIDGGNTWAEIACVPADRTTYADDTVSPNATYTYRVRCLGPGGYSEYSNPAGVTTPTDRPCDTGESSIRADFNGTPIAEGCRIWFNSIVRLHRRRRTDAATLRVDSSTIRFLLGRTPVTVQVPAATITFDSAAVEASTAWDPASQSWVTRVPLEYTGNVFLTGVAYPLTSPIRSSIKDVRWTARFSQRAAPGVTPQWKWAAAVYRSFGADLSDVGVKPIDGKSLKACPSGDHAGTPEAYKPYVIGGARGGGGSNYTGSYSGTATVAVPCPFP